MAPAGKGHTSWNKTPGFPMILQGLIAEAVVAPGMLVYAAAAGWLPQVAAAEPDSQVRVLWTMAAAAFVTYGARIVTRVRTRVLQHAVWGLVPCLLAYVAWETEATNAIVAWTTFRFVWFWFASFLKSTDAENAPLDAGRLSNVRILIASDAVPPKLDGVAVFVTNACRELREQGHELRLLTSIEGEETIHGVPVTRCFGIHPSHYPEHKLSFPPPWTLISLFSSFKPDVVHVVDASMGMGSIVTTFCWLFDIPCVLSHHTRIDLYAPYFLPELPPWLAHAVMFCARRSLTGLAPSNLAVCMPLADQLVTQFACRPHRVHMWHSGTDVRSYHPSNRDASVRDALLGAAPVSASGRDASNHAITPKASGHSKAPRRRGQGGTKAGSSDIPIVLYVGRLAPEKNTYVLPDIAKLLQTADDGKPLARLVIVGRGPAQDQLRHDLAGTGAVMLGPRYGEELRRIYAASDIFLTTCTTEAFCLVGLEAMASGLPVVAPSAGGVVELFDDGDQGYFYAPESGKDAVRAVKQAIKEQGCADPDCPMRRRARQLVEAQSWAITYQQAANHYKEAAHGL